MKLKKLIHVIIFEIVKIKVTPIFQVLQNLVPRMELSYDRKYINEETLIQHLYERKIEEETDD